MSHHETRSKDRDPKSDKDVEGHSMMPNPLLGEQLARIRERDIQRNIKQHNLEQEARRPHKKER
jgi:hypothetical protein